MDISTNLKSLLLATGLGYLTFAEGSKQIDNYMNVKKGPMSKMELFEAKGNYGDTLTLFQTKTIKAEFTCGRYGDDDDDTAAGITISVRNPYNTDLVAAYDIDEVANGIDYEREVIQPGDSLTLGRIVEEYTGDDDSEISNADHYGVIYLSDGSYFSVFGSQTLIVVDTTDDREAGFGYDCVVTGPLMAVVGHGDSLRISQTIDHDTKEQNSEYEHAFATDAKFQKNLEKHTSLLSKLESKGELDNYIDRKVGGHDPVDWFEAKGNYGDTLTLFKSETIKAEFTCGRYGDDDDDTAAGITVTVRNPYNTDLVAAYYINERATGIDYEREVIQPGDSLTLGRIVQEYTGDDDSEISNDEHYGVIYLSDGSYFSVFGEQTLIIVDTTNDREAGFGYDCVVTGPFIGVSNYKHSLDVTKNAKMVKDLPTSQKMLNNPFYFQKQMAKYITKYEEAVSSNNGNAFINYYLGNTVGTYVFEAKGNYGDTLTLFQSKTIKAEFTCGRYGDDDDDTAAGITITVRNPYNTDLVAAYDISEEATGIDYEREVIQPGDSVTLGRIVEEYTGDDDSDISSDDDLGVVYLSDGSYFSVFGAQTLIVVDTTNDREAGFGYDCVVTGPYLAGVAKGDLLKNFYHGPTDVDVFKGNKWLSKGLLSGKKLDKFQKNAFAKNSWK